MSDPPTEYVWRAHQAAYTVARSARKEQWLRADEVEGYREQWQRFHAGDGPRPMGFELPDREPDVVETRDFVQWYGWKYDE